VHVTLVLDKRGAVKSEPHVTTVGLIDPDSDEGAEFETEIVDEAETAMDTLSDSDAQNDEVAAETVRVAVRRFVESALKIKPKVTVHLVRT
jgi:ribonuclease J